MLGGGVWDQPLHCRRRQGCRRRVWYRCRCRWNRLWRGDPVRFRWDQEHRTNGHRCGCWRHCWRACCCWSGLNTACHPAGTATATRPAHHPGVWAFPKRGKGGGGGPPTDHPIASKVSVRDSRASEPEGWLTLECRLGESLPVGSCLPDRLLPLLPGNLDCAGTCHNGSATSPERPPLTPKVHRGGNTAASLGSTRFTIPGLCRSMVLSWLLSPPDEESPLEGPSWPVCGSKGNGGRCEATYLQREKGDGLSSHPKMLMFLPDLHPWDPRGSPQWSPTSLERVYSEHRLSQHCPVQRSCPKAAGTAAPSPFPPARRRWDGGFRES